jgi:hypothetical protein
MSQDSAHTTESTVGDGATDGATDGGEATDRGATSHTLVHTVVRTTVGFAALGADEISAFVRTSVQRGQQMEADGHKLMRRYQENAQEQASAAAASRRNLARQAWTTLDENLQALKRTLMLPGPGSR